MTIRFRLYATYALGEPLMFIKSIVYAHIDLSLTYYYAHIPSCIHSHMRASDKSNNMIRRLSHRNEAIIKHPHELLCGLWDSGVQLPNGSRWRHLVRS